MRGVGPPPSTTGRRPARPRSRSGRCSCPVGGPLRRAALDPAGAPGRGPGRRTASSPDLPFAFFGHSMGALISFEVARQLRRQGDSAPAGLLVSVCPAPQVPLGPHVCTACPMTSSWRSWPAVAACPKRSSRTRNCSPWCCRLSADEWRARPIPTFPSRPWTVPSPPTAVAGSPGRRFGPPGLGGPDDEPVHPAHVSRRPLPSCTQPRGQGAPAGTGFAKALVLVQADLLSEPEA